MAKRSLLNTAVLFAAVAVASAAAARPSEHPRDFWLGITQHQAALKTLF